LAHALSVGSLYVLVTTVDLSPFPRVTIFFAFESLISATSEVLAFLGVRKSILKLAKEYLAEANQ